MLFHLQHLVFCILYAFAAGRWSVDMFGMFHCGRQDILPIGDLGVRKGFQTLYSLKVSLGLDCDYGCKITYDSILQLAQ